MVSVGNTTFTRWSYPGSPYSARSVPPNVKRRKLGVRSVIAVTGARKKRMALAADDTGLLGFRGAGWGEWWRPRGRTIGVPETGSGTTSASRSNTSRISSLVMTSDGGPLATIRPSRMANR